MVRLWKLARLSPGPATGTVVCLTGVAGCSLLTPVLGGRIVDGVLAGKITGTDLLLLAAVLVSGAVADAAARCTADLLVARATAALRRRFVGHLFALGLAGLRRRPTGELIGRLVGNCAQAAGAIPALCGIAVSVLTAVGGLTALWLVDWPAGLTFVLGAGAASAPLRRRGRRSTRPASPPATARSARRPR